MTSRRVLPLASLVLLAGLLSGCFGEPDPVETTPLFASEEEAFAAAEETYRAYVDALNQVDLSDPATFEPVFAWTTGDANANERETLSRMHGDGWHVSGATVILGFTPLAYDDLDETVSSNLCTDVSSVQLTDSVGASKVPPERPDNYTLDVRFTPGETRTGLVISSSHAIASNEC